MKFWRVEKARTAHGSNLLKMPECLWIPVAMKEIPLDGQEAASQVGEDNRTPISYELTYLVPEPDVEQV